MRLRAMAEIIVALDLSSSDEALALVDRIADRVDFYKVGSPLFTRCGPAVVQALRERGKRVFLDLKYHDIPNTVAGAVESAAELGVELLTLHSGGGAAMLRAARAAAGTDGPRLVAVTLLTSLGVSDVEQVWNREVSSMHGEVLRLAAVAAEAELDGVVASPLECEAIKRRHGAAFLVVTPGIRPAGHALGDQVRTATPLDAQRAGADYLVIGRPVLQADDPVAVIDGILADVAVPEAEAF